MNEPHEYPQPVYIQQFGETPEEAYIAFERTFSDLNKAKETIAELKELLEKKIG